MVVWSSFRRFGYHIMNTMKVGSRSGAPLPSASLVSTRQMSGHRQFYVFPSKYPWLKFKDMALFYICVGCIPWILVITYVNLYIGPAQLAPIPEGYVPKEWEYYRHPITRFIAKYIMPTEQEAYEIQLNAMYEEEEKINMVVLSFQIEELMAKKRDYKLFWHRPVTTKYHQHYKKKFEEVEDETFGSNVDTFP